MKKSLVIFGIYFLLMVSLSFFISAEKYCVDSDDGISYFAKGIVSYSSSSETEIHQANDFCFAENTVKEFYCENKSMQFKVYSCPSNFCQDGACIDCSPVGLRVFEKYCSAEGKLET
jgi:hypothetical protein